MPLYEYECQACGARFELIRKFSDPDVEVCTKCGKGPVTRLLSSPAIQFKGSGWYITDYAKKGSSSSTDAASPAAKPAASGDAPATTTKDAKAETPAKPAAKSDSKD